MITMVTQCVKYTQLISCTHILLRVEFNSSNTARNSWDVAKVWKRTRGLSNTTGFIKSSEDGHRFTNL